MGCGFQLEGGRFQLEGSELQLVGGGSTSRKGVSTGGRLFQLERGVFNKKDVGSN